MSTIHEIKVPFHHWGMGEQCGWAPGCTKVEEGVYRGHVLGEEAWADGACYVADDWGHMLITEIHRVSIPGFEDRIFYTRQWRGPDGETFGKRGLRCKGARAFKQMLKGWRHTFYLNGELVNAKEQA